jgi:hypothetical protein
MSARVGLNGFGRTGPLALRAGFGRQGLTFTQINEVACDAAASAHLLEFDSVHGRWPRACAAVGSVLSVEGLDIRYTRLADAGAPDWSGTTWSSPVPTRPSPSPTVPSACWWFCVPPAWSNRPRHRRWRELFFDAPFEADAWSGYSPEVAANPFDAFRQLPVQARYRYLPR